MLRPLTRHPRALLAVSGALVALISGCHDNSPTVHEAETGPLVATTPGLRVVEDSAPAWGASAEWTVAGTPSIDLGDPGQSFLGVPPVLRLPNGNIVVADGASQTIRYFDATGRLLATAGGRGTETGQFHGLGWIGRGAADTVVAYDFIARRFAIFDAKGKFVRTAALMPADSQVPGEPLGSYPDGAVLFRLAHAKKRFAGAAGTVERDSATYARFGLNGAVEAVLGTFPQGENFGVPVRRNSGLTAFPVPFGLQTSVALRADTMLLGTGASFEIASIGPDGKPVGLLSARIPRQPVTPEEARAYTQAAITRLKAGAVTLKASLDTNLLKALEHPPMPAQKPAFGRILVDRTGALWVSAPLSPPSPPTSWTVFAPDGTWLGTVTTPAGLRIDEIGADYVLGVLLPLHGAERVQMYSLTRAGGS
jgi:hypothetical protein